MAISANRRRFRSDLRHAATLGKLAQPNTSPVAYFPRELYRFPSVPDVLRFLLF